MNVNIKYRNINIRFILTLAVLIILSLHQHLNASLIIKDKMDNVSLSNYIQYYEDQDGTLSLDEVTGIPDTKFIRLNDDSTNLGYSDSVYWFKLNIANNSTAEKNWIIESQYPLLDYISIYIPAVSGYTAIHSGDRLPFSTMPHGHFNFISNITSKPGLSTIYIRVRSEGAIITKFLAWDYNSFGDNVLKYISILWLFYGIMTALFFYSIFIFISTKDSVYISLSLLIASCLMFTFVHNGMAKKILWPDMQWWGNFSHPFFVFMGVINMLWFTSLYFNTKINTKKAHTVLQIFFFISIPMSLIIFLLPYSYATKLSVVMTAIIAIFIILFILFPMFFINRRLALYYLSSWFFFSLGDLLLSLRSYGFINNSFIATWSFQISLATGLFFLSLGVADKLNTLRRDNRIAVKTLKESEERYRLFFETAHDAIGLYINEIPAYANRNLINISGYSEEEFYKYSLFDLFPDKCSAEKDFNIIIKEISSGNLNHERFEYILQNKNGTKLPVLISLSSISAGINKGVLIIISDISSIKKASIKIDEQYSEIQDQLKKLETLNRELISAQDKFVLTNSELEKEKEYLSATLTSIGDGVISYDIKGVVFLMNRIAEELTGVSASDAIGKNIREILKLRDEDSKDLLFETLGTVTDKYNFSNIGIPFKMHDKSGNEKIVELNSSVIRLKDEPIGIVLALRDITIKSRIDNELLKMSKLESIGILAGGIAHDFNNLLTGISANVSLLNRTIDIPPEISDSLNDIERAVERATALSKQLLTFAKGGKPVMQPYHVEDLIKESVKFIVKGSSIKIDFEIEKDIPSALIDPNQISQAVNNLLINAIQSMNGNGILTIEIKSCTKLPLEVPISSGRFIQIRIADTGCGIPKKNLNKIFDPFFTTKSSGTGFGLTSTYSIIKQHRGYIKVESEENKGTTFEIFLRASGEKPDTVAISSKADNTSSGGTVLIMDDEEYILEVLAKMLKYHDFDVTTAKTGEEAISLYKAGMNSEKTFDYVILDLTVYNGLGGRETIEILKNIDPEVRAIVSSGYSDNPILANYKEYGFSSILSKPYVIEDVLKAIKDI